MSALTDRLDALDERYTKAGDTLREWYRAPAEQLTQDDLRMLRALQDSYRSMAAERAHQSPGGATIFDTPGVRVAHTGVTFVTHLRTVAALVQDVTDIVNQLHSGVLVLSHDVVFIPDDLPILEAALTKLSESNLELLGREAVTAEQYSAAMKSATDARNSVELLGARLSEVNDAYQVALEREHLQGLTNDVLKDEALPFGDDSAFSTANATTNALEEQLITLNAEYLQAQKEWESFRAAANRRYLDGMSGKKVNPHISVSKSKRHLILNPVSDNPHVAHVTLGEIQFVAEQLRGGADEVNLLGRTFTPVALESLTLLMNEVTNELSRDESFSHSTALLEAAQRIYQGGLEDSRSQLHDADASVEALQEVNAWRADILSALEYDLASRKNDKARARA